MNNYQEDLLERMLYILIEIRDLLIEIRNK